MDPPSCAQHSQGMSMDGPRAQPKWHIMGGKWLQHFGNDVRHWELTFLGPKSIGSSGGIRVWEFQARLKLSSHVQSVQTELFPAWPVRCMGFYHPALFEKSSIFPSNFGTCFCLASSSQLQLLAARVPNVELWCSPSALRLEQSPARSKAPSDGPSEFSCTTQCDEPGADIEGDFCRAEILL